MWRLHPEPSCRLPSTTRIRAHPPPHGGDEIDRRSRGVLLRFISQMDAALAYLSGTPYLTRLGSRRKCIIEKVLPWPNRHGWERWDDRIANPMLCWAVTVELRPPVPSTICDHGSRDF